ncbi:hypothetical protein E4U53_003227, partial [Claviceps sorghi]
MAMLSSKSPFPAALNTPSNASPSTNLAPTQPTTRRAPAISATTQSYTSPTESNFSDSDDSDSVRHWDEERVCDYLRTVKCGDYETIFRQNHINGENLLEMDKEVLKEMGIDKVGDRVRLFLCIKKLRTKTYANQKRRNRDSFAGLDPYSSFAQSSTTQTMPRSAPAASPNRRYSRKIDVPAPLET